MFLNISVEATAPLSRLVAALAPCLLLILVHKHHENSYLNFISM